MLVQNKKKWNESLGNYFEIIVGVNEVSMLQCGKKSDSIQYERVASWDIL